MTAPRGLCNLNENKVDATCKVVLLNDEPEPRNKLKRFLRAYGFDVHALCEQAQLDETLRRERYELLILDLANTPEDNLLLCRRIRQSGNNLPILILANNGDPTNRAIGLETGADGYLTKPFYPREFIARVRALLRRQRIASGAHIPGPKVVRFGEFRYDTQNRRLYRDDTEFDASASQLQILHALAECANRPVSRHNLVAKVGGRQADGHCRSIDIRILRLRQLIEKDPATPRHIRTVWGAGYMLIADSEANKFDDRCEAALPA